MQSVHVEEPVMAAYLPATQFVQLLWAALDDLPAAQIVQEYAPPAI